MSGDPNIVFPDTICLFLGFIFLPTPQAGSICLTLPLHNTGKHEADIALLGEITSSSAISSQDYSPEEKTVCFPKQLLTKQFK